MNPISKATLVLLAMFVVASCGVWLTAPWFSSIKPFPHCLDSHGIQIQTNESKFNTCIEKNAKLFIEKDYAESKDLAKTFLTLLSGILVASITFSEKIVDIHNTKRTPLFGMILCWILLLLAITLTGAGLATMAIAAGYATYYPFQNYRPLEFHATNLFVMGCFSSGMAMMSLVVSGGISLADKRRKIIVSELPHGA